MGHTTAEWVTGLVVSCILVIVGFFVSSGSPGVGGFIAALGAALILFCLTGLSSAKEKIDELQQTTREFEAKARPDKKTRRW